MIVMPGIMRGRLTSHDGALADFVNGIFYTKPGSNFANAQSMFTWSSATGYTRNASGVLVASGANTPKYEWTNAGAALGVFSEGARTNIIQRSQEISTSPWSSSNVFPSADAYTAPDGTATMDKLTASAGSGAKFQIQSVTWTNAVHTISAWARYDNHRWMVLSTWDGTANRNASFDLLNGAVGAVLNTTSGIEDWGGGLYRVWMTGTTAMAAAGGNLLIALNNVDANGATSWTATGNEAIGVWGVQAEAGAFMSSYIPTTLGSATRNADSISRSLGSEFSSSVGTLLAIYSVPSIASSSSDRVIASFDDGTANERFRYRIQSTQADADFLVTDGGVAQCDIDGPAISASTTVKAAMAWAANDFELVVNGTSAGTDVSGTLPTVTTLNLGAGPSGADGLFGHIQRLEYWPSRLTSAQMQGLTT